MSVRETHSERQRRTKWESETDRQGETEIDRHSEGQRDRESERDIFLKQKVSFRDLKSAAATCK